LPDAIQGLLSDSRRARFALVPIAAASAPDTEAPVIQDPDPDPDPRLTLELTHRQPRLISGPGIPAPPVGERTFRFAPAVWPDRLRREPRVISGRGMLAPAAASGREPQVISGPGIRAQFAPPMPGLRAIPTTAPRRDIADFGPPADAAAPAQPLQDRATGLRRSQRSNGRP
jgi:hypothetical protein